MDVPKALRRERLGLSLIAGALVAIFLVAGLVLRNEHQAQLRSAHFHAGQVVRSLSQLSLSELRSRPASVSLLLWSPGADSSAASAPWAYVVVADLEGRILLDVTAKDTPPRVEALPTPASHWFGSRSLQDKAGMASVEFWAPVLEGSERVAQVRAAYLEPTWGQSAASGVFIATLSLPIFLLVPLAYLLFRRELAPLRALTDGETLRPHGAIRSSGAIGDFLFALNRFVDSQREKDAAQEAERLELLSASRVHYFERQRMQSIVACLPFAAFVTDPEGALLLANQKMSKLLRSDDATLRDTPIAEWWEDPEIANALRPFLGGGGDGAPTHQQVSAALGEPKRRFRIIVRRLHHDDEKIDFGTLFLFVDSSDEDHSKRSQHEFLAHVAHELKTPINVFSMYAETLMDKDGEREEFRIEAGNAIQDQVERLAALIDGLLAIARIEGGNLEINRSRVRVADFLKDVVEGLGPEALRRDIRVEAPSTLAALFVDKEMFRVAFTNLLSNALKYSDANDAIRVEADERGEGLVIRVRDNGIGIPQEDQPHVFEKFFRSSGDASSRPGHGLGLPLTKEIIELHGGEIAVTSEAGEGSEFSVSLPQSALIRKATS